MKFTRNLLHFKQLKYGVYTVLMGLIPVWLTVLFFELLIDVKPYLQQVNKIVLTDDYNIKILIYYVIAGCVHITVCAIVGYHFRKSTLLNIPVQVVKQIGRVRMLFLVAVFVLVYWMDNLHIDLSVLSHDRLYILLSKSNFFKEAFQFFPIDYLHFSGQWFRVFSLFPFILICFALIVMVFGGFFVGKEIYNHINKKEIAKEDIKEFVSELNTTLKNYVQLLSIVLVSSTIATVLFFQLPVALIKDAALRENYHSTSMAMGVCWGVIFSLTLLFLCIYPYQLAYKKISDAINKVRISNDPELQKWVDEHKSYYSLIGNLKLVISILSPAAAGIFTTILSHSSF
jgi:hypothetical protein